ncbi:MAG: HD domain-containing protein [Rikenellaceae bacterium]
MTQKYNIKLENNTLRLIGTLADKLGVDAYVVGGYVRDYFLRRSLTDIDVVVVGSGIELAKSLAKTVGARVSVFENFGTAMVRTKDGEIEFVGARKESYRADSRKPIVENGTLDEDQKRRDFTINAMAFCLNSERYGELLDPFEGMEDLEAQLIRTPLDPDSTFSDDPLRMLRAVRFATQLNFNIWSETFDAIARNAHRLWETTSMERVTGEFQKIMMSSNPARGIKLLDDSGLLSIIFPDLVALKGVDRVGIHAHKDNFEHTLQVLENVSKNSDNLWLRYAALFHDIAKPRTKRYDNKLGWTFHGHEVLGARMVKKIFRDHRLPLGAELKYVEKLISLHLRPIILAEDIVTDSAVRRLLFEAGDDIDDLMTLCEADITSKNCAKVQRYLHNFEIVREKLVEIEEKDRVRNFQPPIDGALIMSVYDLEPCSVIGEIKTIIKDAILEGEIPNEYGAAYELMERLAKERGLVKRNEC